MDISDNEEKSMMTIFSDWSKAIFVVIVLFFTYRLFQNIGLISNINMQSQGVPLGVSFLVGVVASFSSCLAVAGSIVLAFGEKYNAGSKNFFDGVVWPNLSFHIGRVATFFVLGGFLGAVGGTINLSGSLVSIYTIVIAVVMGWLGLNILGILPSISTLGLRPPKFFTRFWAQTEKSEHKAAPFLLGGITFFLPCGFTQTMQIVALASGSLWKGAVILSVFSLGTAPILFLLGMSASWGKVKNLGFVQKAAGILIIVFAIFILQSGMALRNVRTNVVSSNSESLYDQSAEKYSNLAPKNAQTVEMHITSSGFEPSTLNVRVGIPVHWLIKGDQVTSCTKRIIVPSYEISQDINFGDNVVSFTPEQKGVINFSCWMGMVRGKFVVE